MASTDLPLIFDAAEAAAALANEVRTTLKTRWPDACALGKRSHRAVPAATRDDPQLVDASSSDAELFPFGAPSMASTAGSNPRVAKRSLKYAAESDCLPHDVTIVHGARRRRRWRVGVLIDATRNMESSANIEVGARGSATWSGLEECHVPVLPLLMRRRRCWRTSSFRRSVSAVSAQNEKVAQIAKKGTAFKFKRLRRIRELHPQSESVSMRTSSGSPGLKSEVDVSCDHFRRMNERGRRPAMEPRSASFASVQSLCEVPEPTAVPTGPIEVAKLNLPGPSQVTPFAAAPPLQQRQIQGSCTPRCTSNLASIVGDAQLPGWSARLILNLGGGAHAAKPLACVSRDTAWSLLRDAVQLSAELRPIAHALAGASAWGDKEEIQFACVQNSGAMLSVFATLDIGTCCVGERSAFKRLGVASQLSRRPRRQTQVRAMDALRDSEVRIEQVRVNRIGCLLSNLAQRARSLSHLLVATPSGASRPSQVPF